MVSDDGLRMALADRTAQLAPDVEAELESLLRRAGTRRRVRRGGFAVGLAAAVAAGAVLVGLDKAPRADTPEPVDTPVTALVPDRGRFADPATIAPGRYRVHIKATSFGPTSFGEPRRIDIDVPAGWGQDDKYALATGPPTDPTARRLDFFSRISRVHPDPCSSRTERVGPGALEVARSLASPARVMTGRPQPVTIAGETGYLVRLDTPTSVVPESCGGRSEPWTWPGSEGVAEPGWTELVYVLDVGGRHLVTIIASHGPEATEAEVDELVRMVGTVTFVPP